MLDSGSQPVRVDMEHLHPGTWHQTTARSKWEISELLAPESDPGELSANLGSSLLELVPSTHFWKIATVVCVETVNYWCVAIGDLGTVQEEDETAQIFRKCDI